MAFHLYSLVDGIWIYQEKRADHNPFSGKRCKEDMTMAYKRKETENMEGLLTNGKKKFVKYDEGAAMFSMGLHSFMDLAKEAKAVYRIRRIVLVNTEIIEEYLENFREL